MSKHVSHSLFTAHCHRKTIGKNLFVVLHHIFCTVQNYINREEFTFTDHYLNQLINSLINYFFFFQNSQNMIASFILGFLPTIHSLFSFTDTPLYIEEIHCSLQPYPKTLSRQLPLKMFSFPFFNRLHYWAASITKNLSYQVFILIHSLKQSKQKSIF